ncbi:hypothetical protein [Leifsonia sp. EB34]|uniref:hypothetical protein n=1 Tax=Leifsonia sp. EB34 TaxID=3156303 RepID=UPI003517D898
MEEAENDNPDRLWQEPPPEVVAEKYREQGLHIRSEAPEPLTVEQADLGTKLATAPPDGSSRPHRLVVIGGSISQGFQSFAIFNTDHSWPVLAAEAFGFGITHPVFADPRHVPGMPLNLEGLARSLNEAFPGIKWYTWIPELLQARSLAKQVQTYWTDAELDRRNGGQDPAYENLACWGFDIRDCLSASREWCREQVKDTSNPSRFLVAHAQERSALITLSGGKLGDSATTQIAAAQSLGAENNGAGIETLVVELGANNALRSIGELKIHWSKEGFDNVDRKSKFNVWTPEHFEIELGRLADEVKRVNAAHTIWMTVPHVTIVPLLHGIGQKPPDSRYFVRYTHPWLSDGFNGNQDPCLTADDARAIDAAIDQYNWAIKKMVHAARTDPADPRDWLLVDLCGLLDLLAYRRYQDSPQSQPTWWTRHPDPLPPALLALSPRPDSRFFLEDKHGRTQGGLFSLDGVHPTTIAYGLLAENVVRVMADVAGVRPGDGRVRPQINFDALIARDTLVSEPIPRLTDDYHVVGIASHVLDLAQAIFGKSPATPKRGRRTPLRRPHLRV